MLGDKTVVANIAVKDMAAAQKFYEGTLGLTKADGGEDSGGTMYRCGSSNLFVYQSQYAGTNQATSASWGVGDDIEKIVEDLKSKGVSFEHYDNMPGATLQGDIHVMGELKAAWFKDPDGNIISLINRM